MMLAGSFVLGLLLPTASFAGILSESDFRQAESVKPLFANLMKDLVETAKRSDVASGDAGCINSTIRELLQISDELASYEYLITMEKEMTDFGDKSPVRDIVKFAVDKSSTILASERKRLVQLSDQCTKYPLGFGKTQEALKSSTRQRVSSLPSEAAFETKPILKRRRSATARIVNRWAVRAVIATPRTFVLLSGEPTDSQDDPERAATYK